jgi:hypothetical protein
VTIVDDLEERHRSPIVRLYLQRPKPDLRLSFITGTSRGLDNLLFALPSSNVDGEGT